MMLTKIVVNRLKSILMKVIAPSQCSSVPERQITNNVVVLQEVVHSMHKHRVSKG